LDVVRRLRCLIAYKYAHIQRWRGIYPNRKLETIEVQHVCDSPAEAHHVRTKARGGHDRETVPLCRAAHSELHQIGATAFESRWKVDLRAVAARIGQQ
jgi:hypothetical protein